MSEDPKAAVQEAKTQLRSLAGRSLARKESLEAQLKRTEADLEDLGARAEAAVDAGDDATAQEILTLRTEVEAKLDAQRTALAEAEATHDEVLAKLKETDQLASRAEADALRATVASLASPDPLSPSAVDTALENARSGILEAEARADLERELSGAADPKLDREFRALAAREREEKARAELERLKASRKPKKDEPSEPTGAGRPKGSKRTL